MTIRGLYLNNVFTKIYLKEHCAYYYEKKVVTKINFIRFCKLDIHDFYLSLIHNMRGDLQMLPARLQRYLCLNLQNYSSKLH